MKEDIDDLKEFRKNVNGLFSVAYLSDKAILDKIADRNDEWFKAVEFRDQIKAALYKGVRKDTYESIHDFSDDDAMSFINHLMDRYKHWTRDHEMTQFALEVKECLIDLVGKDLTNYEAIAEIKRLQQVAIVAKEEPIATVVEMNYLRSKVVVLEKVIARLVGE